MPRRREYTVTLTDSGTNEKISLCFKKRKKNCNADCDGCKITLHLRESNHRQMESRKKSSRKTKRVSRNSAMIHWLEQVLAKAIDLSKPIKEAGQTERHTTNESVENKPIPRRPYDVYGSERAIEPIELSFLVAAIAVLVLQMC